MIEILFITISFFLSVDAQTDDDRSKACVNDLIKWCENKDYRNIGQSSSLSSTSDNGSNQVVRCLSNSYGTKCTENNSPWIECSIDHKTTYKGNVLRKNSSRGADGEICNASRFVNTNASETSNEKDDVFKDCFPFCKNNPFV